MRHAFATLARFFIAIPIAFMGVQQCLHPELAPGVPLVKATPRGCRRTRSGVM